MFYQIDDLRTSEVKYLLRFLARSIFYFSGCLINAFSGETGNYFTMVPFLKCNISYTDLNILKWKYLLMCASYAFHQVNLIHTVKFLFFKSFLMNRNNILQWLFLLYHVLLCNLSVYYVKIHDSLIL